MKKVLLLAVAAMLTSWSPPVAAQQAEFDLKEWDVEWGGGTRDPAVGPDGRVWFVGQRGNYVAVFNPATEQFRRYEIEAGTNPHTLIVDNAGGHLMQHGQVDICITGTDRTTRSGDVANKVGTYLKALAARDNNIPFYVALPSTTIDWTIGDGIMDIPIEERDPREVTHITGKAGDVICEVNTVPPDTRVSNYAFDVTPARLVSGLITECGVCDASEQGLTSLFPELARQTG